jgi:membrane protease YdiL (CAAX protease family)
MVGSALVLSGAWIVSYFFSFFDNPFYLDDIGAYILALWAMDAILRRCCGLSLFIIGLGPLSTTRVFRGCLTGFIIASVYAIPSALIWPSDTVPFWVKGKFSIPTFRGIMGLILGVLIGPLYEEAFFRGILHRSLRTKLSWSLSTLLCVVFFALLHDPPAQTAGALLLGLVTCYIMEKRGSITECFAIHAAYNFFVLAERIGYEYVTMVAHR